jgi:hypothetical protein
VGVAEGGDGAGSIDEVAVLARRVAAQRRRPGRGFPVDHRLCGRFVPERDPFVLRTVDGGSTWQTVTPPGSTRAISGANCGFADVAIVDASNVWIVGVGGV